MNNEYEEMIENNPIRVTCQTNIGGTRRYGPGDRITERDVDYAVLRALEEQFTVKGENNTILIRYLK